MVKTSRDIYKTTHTKKVIQVMRNTKCKLSHSQILLREGLETTPLTKKKIETWTNMHIDDFDEEVKRNPHDKREKLIDLKKDTRGT